MGNLKREKKIVFFDFDGVIADSFEAAMVANKTINPWFTEDDQRNLFIGNVNDSTIKRPNGEMNGGDNRFFEEYIPLMTKLVRIFPGMAEVIINLRKKYYLVVISSTPTRPIEKFLKNNGLNSYFESIMGNDICCSKSMKIRQVISNYTTKPNNCVLITDTLGDMREAHDASIISIGVEWGYHKKEHLLIGNPYKIVQKPEEIYNVVFDVLK
jgi:phosphoglycolate phosphatase